MKHRLFLLILSLCVIFCIPALGEDLLTVNIGDESSIETDRNYLQVICRDVNGELSLSVQDGNGKLIYQKSHGFFSGDFYSDDLYLPLTGSETTYTVTLSIGEETKSLSVLRKLPRLTGNSACSVGIPLSTLNGRDGWQAVTLIDLSQQNGSSFSVPMIASGAYTLGNVSFTLIDGTLNVNAAIANGIDGSIDRATVYIATNALEAQSLGTRSFRGITAPLGSDIPLQGADYAIVYVQLTVSFAPDGVPDAPSTLQPGQSELWEIINQTTINEAIG